MLPTSCRKKGRRGRDVELSMCEPHYKCKLCQKVLERSKRKPNEHVCGEWKCTNCFEYQIGQHLCYQRKPSKHLKSVPKKYFFYDFECTQNEIMNCEDGYTPGEPCAEKCTTEARCNRCRKCIHYGGSWCGLEEHKVNCSLTIGMRKMHGRRSDRRCKMPVLWISMRKMQCR